MDLKWIFYSNFIKRLMVSKQSFSCKPTLVVLHKSFKFCCFWKSIYFINAIGKRKSYKKAQRRFNPDPIWPDGHGDNGNKNLWICSGEVCWRYFLYAPLDLNFLNFVLTRFDTLGRPEFFREEFFSFG